MEKKYSLLDTPAPTWPLAVLAPSVFMWSNNWHSYVPGHLAFSLGLLLAILTLVLILMRNLHLAHIRKPHTRKDDLGFGLLICAAAAGLMLFFLETSLERLFFITGLGNRSLLAILTAAFSLTAYFGGFKALNGFLAVWLALSGLSLGYGLLSSPKSEFQSPGFEVALEKKPNIYLFFQESFHSLPVLEEVYGVDVEPIRSYLTEKGFTVYDRAMSNSPYTLSSMTDTFTMRPAYQLSRNLHDVSPGARLAIGGSADNALYRMLKDNGYKTIFLTKGSHYYFNAQGPYLDETDLDLSMVRLRPFWELNSHFSFLSEMSTLTEPPVYVGTLSNRLHKAVDRHLKSGRPYLLIFEGGVIHTPNAKYYGAPEVFEQWKPKYVDALQRIAKPTREIIDFIIDHDPGALIVTLGDHGAQGYHGLFDQYFNSGDKEGFLKTMADHGLTVEQVAADYFRVLLAVRLPHGEPADISAGLPLSHVNLFRHLFAYLNNDPSFLDTRSPARSVIARLVLGRDNEAVCETLDEELPESLNRPPVYQWYRPEDEQSGSSRASSARAGGTESQ